MYFVNSKNCKQKQQKRTLAREKTRENKELSNNH